MKTKLIKYLSLTVIVLVISFNSFSQKADIFYNPSPQVDFSVKELEKAIKVENIQKYKLEKSNLGKAKNQIVLIQLNDTAHITNLQKKYPEKIKEIASEGFSLLVEQNKNNRIIYVIGADEPGLMYGTLELAEQIRLNGLLSVSDTKQNPYMKIRGTKFNIPLDVRTPSYTDVCDAAQQNIANMWDMKFWTDYIDHLAKDRYNLISLWNLHPFPSMVKVAEYPEVALNDVQQSRVKWNEFYSLSGSNFCQPSIISNVEVIKKMTIDEKIDFWRKVMKYGKERNVNFYILTWNIFVFGAQDKYGITDDFKNPVTIDYFRKSVKQMILTYPDLMGIGLTTGENFAKATTEEKEEWAFEAFGLGVLDAEKIQPDRKITFIHRQHQTGALAIADKFKPLIDNKNINFLFSFKYAQAHVFSAIDQPFCNNFVDEISSRGNLKTIWTMRNDDNYYFRWGAPNFVRDFIKNVPYDVSEGFYYGSDQWIWGREFLSKDPSNSRELEIEKHWYHWMLWGRLGYNPDLKNERIIQMLSDRFREVPAKKLFTAWENASMIYPLTTGFHWGAMDFQWYIEACKSHPKASNHASGFHDVNMFITLPPHPGTKNQSIPNFVKMVQAGGHTDSITPIQVAKMLHERADIALKLIKEIKVENNKELESTLNDIETIAYLGKYYAYKIMGATEVQQYRILNDNKIEHQKYAVNNLTQAAIYWKKYAELSKKSYKNPIWTNRVGTVDFDQIYEWVLDDIRIAKEIKE